MTQERRKLFCLLKKIKHTVCLDKFANMSECSSDIFEAILRCQRIVASFLWMKFKFCGLFKKSWVVGSERPSPLGLCLRGACISPEKELSWTGLLAQKCLREEDGRLVTARWCNFHLRTCAEIHSATILVLPSPVNTLSHVPFWLHLLPSLILLWPLSPE